MAPNGMDNRMGWHETVRSDTWWHQTTGLLIRRPQVRILPGAPQNPSSDGVREALGRGPRGVWGHVCSSCAPQYKVSAGVGRPPGALCRGLTLRALPGVTPRPPTNAPQPPRHRRVGRARCPPPQDPQGAHQRPAVAPTPPRGVSPGARLVQLPWSPNSQSASTAVNRRRLRGRRARPSMPSPTWTPNRPHPLSWPPTCGGSERSRTPVTTSLMSRSPRTPPPSTLVARHER